MIADGYPNKLQTQLYVLHDVKVCQKVKVLWNRPIMND